MILSERVATRRLQAYSFDTEVISTIIDRFKQTYPAYVELFDIAQQKEGIVSKKDYTDIIKIWVMTMFGIPHIARWMLETRSIPAGKAKAVELAARLFNKVNYTPSKQPIHMGCKESPTS